MFNKAMPDQAKLLRQQKQFNKTHNIREDGQIHLAALNVDELSPNDLKIVVNHPALNEHVRKYAELILEARSLRLAGEIRKATWIEDKCDQIYEQDIPKSCRW